MTFILQYIVYLEKDVFELIVLTNQDVYVNLQSVSRLGRLLLIAVSPDEILMAS